MTMSVSQRYRYRHIYHFTHLDNLPQILADGLLAHNELLRLGKRHTSIAYDEIQDRRSTLSVPCGPGGVVHDYIPFYFCMRSSMLLAVVNNKIADQMFIIYLYFPITIMEECPSVFTDAAANTSVTPSFYDDPEDLERLNWQAIDSLKWRLDPEETNRQRMAELLIHKTVDMARLSRIVVWNESIRDNVEQMYGEAGLPTPTIGYESKHYFLPFYASDENRRRSIVMGPYVIASSLAETVEQLLPEIGKAQSAPYSSLKSLLEALRGDMGVLPETAELVGLESDNEMHSEDVGTHTLKVFDKLRDQPEYENLSPTDKILVELAAYLHDIGKGPKSRWARNGGRQQVDPDHSVKALPMVRRILTEDVASLKKRSAKVICKLVCYHDLVGDIVGKGRRPEELIDVVEDPRELDMLIALGKADMLSVDPLWLLVNQPMIDALRERVVVSLSDGSDDDPED